MEVRAFAMSLLEARTLETKLDPGPRQLSDETPGPALRIESPGRPPELALVPRQRVVVPPAEAMHDPAQRARILHALANHELQAAELFAFALLAWPDAPRPFRRGLLAILREEQSHMQLYLDRLASMDVAFGSLPVNGHFWAKVASLRTPLDFVCTMGLTFENANLDFCPEHIRAAHKAGDTETASVLERVHREEIRHVRFAWRWMRRFKSAGSDDWTATWDHVAPPHGPARARGATFDRAAREAAGLSPAFIDQLSSTSPTRPGGHPRQA